MNPHEPDYHFHAAITEESAVAVVVEEETLVADACAGRPPQMVDRKLASLLESTSLPTTQLPNARLSFPQEPGRLVR